MKVIVCDKCKSTTEIPSNRALGSPEGWGSMTLSMTIPTPYRSVSDKQDWCGECLGKRFPKLGDKVETPDERLLDFVREWINDEVSDAMEQQ